MGEMEKRLFGKKKILNPNLRVQLWKYASISSFKWVASPP
jgi:hypothetical protein